MADEARVDLPLSFFPDRLQPVIAPTAAPERKLMVARAAVPLPPELLVAALSFLLDDSDQSVRNTARKSLHELPAASVTGVLASQGTHPGVLDRLARVFHDDAQKLHRIVLNRSIADGTLLHVARHGDGAVLDVLAANQERIARCPDLVPALYYNRNTRMSTVSRVLEFAVRQNLPIHHMPGYREIVASVLGDARLARPAAAPTAPDAEQPQPTQAAQPPEPHPMPAEDEAPEQPADDSPLTEKAFSEWGDMGEAAAELAADDPELFQELLGAAQADGFTEESTSPGLDEDNDDAFFALLSSAMTEGEEDGTDRESPFMADKIKDMGVPERVRLALMGNATCRSILVKDPNKLVSAAVLRNPGLNDKEIIGFAANKAVSGDVIRMISNSREWLRNYQVKIGLVMNPKTPVHVALSLLKFVLPKHLKDLARSRDISPTIARAAKRLMDEKKGGEG
jgi:hypothetical protein